MFGDDHGGGNMPLGIRNEDEPGKDQVVDETVALLHALRSVLDQETADRLFPQAWRHLRRIRSGPQKQHHRIVNTPPSR